MAPTRQTRELTERIMESLDYDALGAIYCDDGGRAFWEDRRRPVVEAGLEWAHELCARVSRGGHSLYVGAGVAELPVLLAEVSDLGRRCTVTCLRERECELLNASLRSAGVADTLRFACVDAAEVTATDIDHLSMVSVLDDPETFPWVSQVTYGRAAPWELDVDAFSRERVTVRGLVASLFDRLRLPAVVTTTGEEVPWLLEQATERGWITDTDDTTVETALVGDPLGFLAIREASA